MSDTRKYGRKPGALPPECMPPGGFVPVMWKPPAISPAAKSHPNTPWKNVRPRSESATPIVK